MISQIKKEVKNILILDTGNLLFRKPLQTETKRRDAILRADLLIKSYNEMGYDAVNVGEKDLMMGLKFLNDIANKAKFPFISANLIEKKGQKPIFKQYIIKEISGLKIGIIGLMDDQYNTTLNDIEPELSILEPISVTKNIVKGLREYCHLIIVLSQFGESKLRKLSKETSGIDLILGGGGESTRAYIDIVNDVPIYRLEPRGGYLGRIDYSISNMNKPIRFASSIEREELEKRLERLKNRYTQIKSEMEKSGKKEEVRLKELRFIESKKIEVEKALLAMQDKNFYKHKAIPIPLSIPEDQKIIKYVEDYRIESAKLYKPKIPVIQVKDLSDKELIARIPKNSLYIGAISCKRCHETNYKNWLKTKHAKATQTIIPSPKYAQEECLICHSTGYGKVGEYSTVEEVPFYLQGVQCEACHGEGRGHPEKGSIERKVTLGTCRNCHTKDQSPLFNYSAYLEKIGCKISK